jgi:SAM-dependent methyltransferase
VSTAGPGAKNRLQVDEVGFRFPAATDFVCDVLFDDRRIWSVDPGDFPVARGGWREVRWPPPVSRQLDGAVRVSLVRHGSDDVVGVVDAEFGSGEGRVEIVDAAGHPAALTKWGRLVQPFATTDRAAIDAYLDQVESVLDILRDRCGVPAFLSFGSLLGAVREGKVIAHDVDVDLGYLSAFENPVDAMLESFRIERVLTEAGHRITRNSGGFIAMDLKQPDGTTRNLDIFTAMLFDGRLYQVNDVDVEADESAVLPLQQIDFEGRKLPAPAEPELFLESAYGPHWRVPNPAFTFERPRRQRRRIRGWFGGMRERRDYWGRFYAASGHRVPKHASPFAQWVAEREQGRHLVDLGCGNARDTRFFAERGFSVTGVDAVTRHARRGLAGLPAEGRPRLRQLNLESLRDTLRLGAQLARADGEHSVYARFVMHALSDPARENAWRLITMVLRSGGRGYLEFRTPRDARRPKAFGDHYRRFLAPDEVEQEAKRFGLHVTHREVGTGLSPFEGEDPVLCRMIVERNPE